MAGRGTGSSVRLGRSRGVGPVVPGYGWRVAWRGRCGERQRAGLPVGQEAGTAAVGVGRATAWCRSVDHVGDAYPAFRDLGAGPAGVSVDQLVGVERPVCLRADRRVVGGWLGDGRCHRANRAWAAGTRGGRQPFVELVHPYSLSRLVAAIKSSLSWFTLVHNGPGSQCMRLRWGSVAEVVPDTGRHFATLKSGEDVG